jgi:hypothetical protein
MADESPRDQSEAVGSGSGRGDARRSQPTASTADAYVEVRRDRDSVAEQLRLLRRELKAWQATTRDDGGSIQDIREELLGTLREQLDKAVAETRVTTDEVARQVESLVPQVDGRVRDVLAGHTKTLDDRFSGVAEEFRSNLEALVEEAKGLQASVEKKRVHTEAILNALIEVSDQQAEHVVQYQPGTIQQLRQRIAVLEDEQSELRAKKREAEAQLIDAQREVESYKAQHGLRDIKELDAQKEELKKQLEGLRRDIGNIEQLRVNYDALQVEANELRAARSTYETVQREAVDAAQMRAQIASLEGKMFELDQERRDANERATRVQRVIDGLRRDKDKLAGDVSRLEGESDRLKASLESHVAREQDFEDRSARVEAERQRLDEREREIERELRDRGEELHAKDRMLDEEYRRRHQDLWDKVILEHQDALTQATRGREEAERTLETLKAAIDGLKQELAAMHRKELDAVAAIRERELAIDRLEIAIRRHDTEAQSLVDRIAQLQSDEKEARQRVRDAESALAGQDAAVKRLEAEAAEIRGQIERLRKDRDRQEKGVTHEERIKAIRQTVAEPREFPLVSDPVAEVAWLQDVRKGIEASGFNFPERLLQAFHTSLKIADWSSLTVLAGVSGTGKSELPKLYSRFGGIEFLQVPVLPNWDSPTDLFGFFDYLSGQFKPTQLLQTVVQCSEQNRMLVVMLDEMNLARVELYFSELLSRLEGRRHEGDTPIMPVDIGSGMDPYDVQLGSNLLFVGTVNEDESTNTLSDKVLDRANVIYFPRPRDLVTRDQDRLADRARSGLSPRVWQSWQRGTAVLDPAVREQIKSAFNQINQALSLVNRAVAHRILQTTERYVANHPLVFAGQNRGGTGAAWKVAFGDQIAQKVMPKLRGVTVDSKDGSQCLDRIAKVVGEHCPDLRDDYKRAREAGEGQFIWCSAGYLEGGETTA